MARKHIPDRLLLWLAIHGGDPVPDKLDEVDQLLLFQAMYDVAGQLSDVNLRKEVQGVASKAIAAVAQEMARGVGR
jgi:hypothetical protein